MERFHLRQCKVCMIIECLLRNNHECMSILNKKYLSRISPRFAKKMMNGPKFQIIAIPSQRTLVAWVKRNRGSKHDCNLIGHVIVCMTPHWMIFVGL